ncbi:MAG TPA: hypothetical protein VLK65_17630 [Vicinamibacteria bacterium]|nr:hypothetical protein [Vicinamibacteria bacterium]
MITTRTPARFELGRRLDAMHHARRGRRKSWQAIPVALDRKMHPQSTAVAERLIELEIIDDPGAMRLHDELVGRKLHHGLKNAPRHTVLPFLGHERIRCPVRW